MASWTDGAAYAPIERPDGFATPEVEPLSQHPELLAATPGALPPPAQFTQTVALPPLDRVATTLPPTRNASEPFRVLGGLMTTASSMNPLTDRDPRAPFQSSQVGAGRPDTDMLPPPTGNPLPPPMGQPLPQTGPGGFGAPMRPGMPWDPARRGVSPQEASTQRTLALLAVVCCVLGFTLGTGAPVLLFVAGLLSLRAGRITGKAGYWAMGSGLVLIMFGILLEPGAEIVYGRLACLAYGIWVTTATVRRSKKGL